MVAVVANTKTYLVKPADGWTLISTGATTLVNFFRASADPHTHPFFVYVGPTAPAASVRGIKVCHKPFVFHDDTNGTSSNFYVRLTGTNPGNQQGGIYIDVLSEGGVLA